MSLTLQSMGQKKGEYTADCGDLPGIKKWSLNHIWLWAGILNNLMHSILCFFFFFLSKEQGKVYYQNPWQLLDCLQCMLARHCFTFVKTDLYCECWVSLCCSVVLDAALRFAYLLQNHYHASKFFKSDL